MSEKSIAQIIAGIKAKIPELDAQLNAIEVGELSETGDLVWRVARDVTQRLTVLADEIDDHLSDEQAVRLVVYDLRHPLGNVTNALDLLLHFEEFSAEFSSIALMRIQCVFDEIQGMTEKADRLVAWYRSQRK